MSAFMELQTCTWWFSQNQQFQSFFLLVCNNITFMCPLTTHFLVLTYLYSGHQVILCPCINITADKEKKKSKRKVPGQADMVERPSEAELEHGLVAFPEPITVRRRRVRLDLVLKKITKLFLEIGPLSFFGRNGDCRRRWRGRDVVSGRSGVELGFKPHVGQHLANTFFHLRTKIRITCQCHRRSIIREISAIFDT